MEIQSIPELWQEALIVIFHRAYNRYFRLVKRFASEYFYPFYPS